MNLSGGGPGLLYLASRASAQNGGTAITQYLIAAMRRVLS
jgi:hypothetical protein